MKQFARRVAVVTGAASGIGLADVEEHARAAAARALEPAGAAGLPCSTDGSQAADVEALAGADAERDPHLEWKAALQRRLAALVEHDALPSRYS